MRSTTRPLGLRDAALALMVISGVAVVPIDFDELGLSRDSGVDLFRLALLAPSVIAGAYVLVASPPTRRLLARVPVVLFGLWLAWAWVGLAFSVDPRQTLVAAVTATGLLLGVCWFVVRFGVMAFGGAAVFALTGVTLIGFGQDAVAGFEGNRMDGITFGFNDLAILASIGLIWVLVLQRMTGHRWWLLFTPVFAVALIGSGARTPAMATALVAVVLLARTRTSRLVMAALVVLAALTLVVSPLSDRFSRDVGPAQAETSATTLNGRIEVWSEVPELVEQRPFLGHGFKSGNETWEAEYLASDVPFRAGHSHNLLLELVVAGGVVGASLFIGAVAISMWIVAQSPGRPLIALPALLLLLGLTEAVIEGPTTGLVMFFAVAAAASQRAHTAAPEGHPPLKAGRPVPVRFGPAQ